MDVSASIREAIKSIVRDLIMDSSLQCRVVSVDRESNTITAKSTKENLDYANVKLIALNGTGIIAYPTKDSIVSISFIDGVDTMAFVSQYSQIDGYSIALQSGIKLELKEGQVLINGSSFGGLVKVDELVQKVNRLESRMNTHQHISASPGNPTAPDPTTNSPLTLTQRQELENATVKHG